MGGASEGRQGGIEGGRVGGETKTRCWVTLGQLGFPGGEPPFCAQLTQILRQQGICVRH